MSTLTGSEVIARARALLLDSAGVTWPDAELIDWLNDGRMEMCNIHRPDIYEATEDFVCVDGERQTLPSSARKLFRVHSNRSHPDEREITPVSRDALARYRPKWRAEPFSTEIKHYIYDERDDAQFEVYPPAQNGITIRISYAKPPVKITGGTVGSALVEEGADAVALVDYLCYRAFLKEGDATPVMVDRAMAHYQMFVQKLTGVIPAKILVSPNANAKETRPPTA